MSQLIDNELGRIFIMCGFAGSCCLGREKFSFATMKVACVSATEAVFKLGDRTRVHVYG